jgi:hypothetical protein
MYKVYMIRINIKNDFMKYDLNDKENILSPSYKMIFCKECLEGPL